MEHPPKRSESHHLKPACAQGGYTKRRSWQKVEQPIYPPPCKCLDCLFNFRTLLAQRRPGLSYSKPLSELEATSIITKNIQNIQAARKHLLQVLSLHGDLVMSRWKKKSQAKRCKLLIEIDAGLYDHQWLLCRLPSISGCQVHAFRNPIWRRRLLIPWLNLEILKTDPDVLLSLFHHRATHPPQDWVRWDNRQLDLGWSKGYFDVNYSNTFVVISGPKYGKVVTWGEGTRHQQEDIGFPRAQLILEAQELLMDLLCRVVDRILDGADVSKPASVKWEHVISQGYRKCDQMVFQSSYTWQAFSTPPSLSMESLLSIAETRMRAAGDHLALLQCEPSYMRRYIKIMYQGELCKAFDANAMDLLALQEITEDVLHCWKWKWVTDKCAQVKQVHDRYHQSGCSRSLRSQYSNALWGLELFLLQCLRGDIQRLRRTLSSHPGFCIYLVIEDAGFYAGESARAKKKKEPSFEEDALGWCMINLLEDPDCPQGYDHAMLFAYLQHHLTTSPHSEQARVDELLYRRLSDLASIQEMLQSVRLNRPQNGSRDVSDDLNQVESKELWRNVFLRPQFNNNSIGNPQVVANILIDQLYRQSPPHGPRNLVWLQQFRAMESSLGEFWAAVRRWAKKYLDHLDLRAMEEKVLMDSISVDLSPEHLQLRREQADRIISDAKRESGPSPVPLQTEWGSEAIEVPLSISGPRVKSRPTASGNTTGEAAHNGDRTPDTPKEFSQQIFVTKDSLHVIHLMFPEFSDRSDSVGWEKFVRALCDAGFIARNGGGSAVVFDAQNGLQRGKIVFHRPHPVAKLDPVMLRSMGKRMTKWFGWTRNGFSAK